MGPNNSKATWVCHSDEADPFPPWQEEIPFRKFIKQLSVCKFDQETQKDSTPRGDRAELSSTAESSTKQDQDGVVIESTELRAKPPKQLKCQKKHGFPDFFYIFSCYYTSKGVLESGSYSVLAGFHWPSLNFSISPWTDMELALPWLFVMLFLLVRFYYSLLIQKAYPSFYFLLCSSSILQGIYSRSLSNSWIVACFALRRIICLSWWHMTGFLEGMITSFSLKIVLFWFSCSAWKKWMLSLKTETISL